MLFRVLRATSDGALLLSSDSAQPVDGRAKLFDGRKEVATVLETIGRVDRPLFVGRLAEAARKGYLRFEGMELETRDAPR
ncbi:hypothetical protein HY995_05920 [Candidatus Micrarchaeota archaeon]|nr:hypothetical protein [Candidatus Micrarchaeota archaeon]MBI5177591.1 hypothetical protein [Candidatus Micrarchaeota archaeon]